MRGAPGLDLTTVESVDFGFGPSFGSSGGRVGFDDLEITQQ
jgi:hypothetical protein